MNRQASTKSLAFAIAAALGGHASGVDAVVLDARGAGQVLIYPYYTVNHQQTLISLVNATDVPAALKVRFREGYDGREVASFNLYLGGADTWVGSVFDTSGDGSGGAAIATTDSSCTVPQFDSTFFPGGAKVLAFSNKNYSQGDYGTPTGTDSGPTGLDRTREGFIEVIQMGTVAGSSGNALLPFASGAPQNCPQLVNAWMTGGYWATDPGVDLGRPIGGLYGAAGIVDVAEGTLYSYDATAIDGFSDIVQHTAPGDPKPNLSTAVTDSAHDIATAYVPIGNAMIKADYPASTRAVDAVSAVLMADTLFNEFDIEPDLGASSDWVVTFPTKQFYVDPGIVGTADSGILPPFSELWLSRAGSMYGLACNPAGYRLYDREGSIAAAPSLSDVPPATSNYLCYQTSVLPLRTYSSLSPTEALASSLFNRSVPEDRPILGPAPQSASGHFLLSFTQSYIQHGATYTVGESFVPQALRPSFDGNVFPGLPAIGFLAVNYINANVAPGVLSNYSAAYPHRSTASCTNSTNPQSVCQ
ncbi:MAG TPA: hypothetical protein VFI49_10400 [Rudaea sp.]|nr:hypothetical protein [Rudaea sp.]